MSRKLEWHVLIDYSGNRDASLEVVHSSLGELCLQSSAVLDVRDWCIEPTLAQGLWPASQRMQRAPVYRIRSVHTTSSPASFHSMWPKSHKVVTALNSKVAERSRNVSRTIRDPKSSAPIAQDPLGSRNTPIPSLIVLAHAHVRRRTRFPWLPNSS